MRIVMAKNNLKRPFTVDIWEGLADKFEDFRIRSGFTKWQAITGALRAYMSLPADVQVALNAPDMTVEAAGKLITDKICDLERIRLLGKLDPGQVAYLREITKEVAEHLSGQ
jgi:hypothetical protein